MIIPQEIEHSPWLAADGWLVEIINQTKLPHEVNIVRLCSGEDAARAVPEIPIDRRHAQEVTHVIGAAGPGRCEAVRIMPAGTLARNDACDVTSAALVTGLITERGVCAASAATLKQFFPRLRKRERAAWRAQGRAPNRLPDTLPLRLRFKAISFNDQRADAARGALWAPARSRRLQ